MNVSHPVSRSRARGLVSPPAPGQRSSEGARRGPALIADVELSRPIAEVRSGYAQDGLRYADALVLVRLHTLPLGAIEVPLPQHGITATALREAILAALGEPIRNHLAVDGIASLDDLSGRVDAGAEPACLSRRRRVLINPPSVTVVVPVVDRPELLHTALKDLASQSYPEFSLIVVDNAPATSGAAAVVAGTPQRRMRVRYIEEPVRGASAARNRGLAASTSEITAFVDADVRIDPHWLIELVGPLVADPGVGVTTGLIMPSELETRAQRWMEEWGGFGKGFAPRISDIRRPESEGPLFPYSAGLGSGVSLAFRTNSLRRIGGYPTTLGPATPARGGEDLAALFDVLMAGDRVAYAPGAIVWHPHPRDEHEFIAKLHDYGVGLTAHLTRAMLRRPRSMVEIGLRVPAAIAYLARPTSDRNAQRRSGFPSRRVQYAELTGMAQGPIAYLASLVSRVAIRSRTRRVHAES